jgi:LysR family transcriptional activator of nhaA
MDWLNYHHLLYFWMVAREGSIAAACQRLHVAQPTISAQIRMLERSLGHRLFARAGRRLVLTEMGRNVYRYADDIFTLGQDLLDMVGGRPAGRPLRFHVGLAQTMPKLLARRLLDPALCFPEPLHLVCVEGTPAELLARLSAHELDVVLADSPSGPVLGTRAFNHLLGESGVSVFALTKAAQRYRKRFPNSLDGAPLLMPTANTVLRRSLDYWMESHEIRPRIVGEFEDSALLKTFGQAGAGLFPGHSVIKKEICQQYEVVAVGDLEGVTEHFYAISMERKIKHPAVLAITEHARLKLLH